MNNERPKTQTAQTKFKLPDETQKKRKFSRSMTRSGSRSIALTPYKRPKTSILQTTSNFGKDAPHISIGCSRPTPPLPEETPGPGSYTPLDNENTGKIFIKIPKAVDKPPKPITADVDFINYRSFPELHPQTFSKSAHRDFFEFDPQIPGPDYAPPSTLNDRGHLIEPIRKIKPHNEGVPGPGYYSPKYEDLRAWFYYSTTKRDFTFIQKNSNPGPGAYNPNYDIEHPSEPKSRLIGKKSRLRKHRKCDPPVKPRGKLIGVSQFLIELEPQMNESETLKYIANHPDLKGVITEMMDQLIFTRPDDPLQFVRDYFTMLKEMRNNNQNNY